jgi:phage I-like protein
VNLQSIVAGQLKLVCQPDDVVVIDFDHHTVTESLSNQPVPAVITADAIAWRSEFDIRQYDPHFGMQTIHHTAYRVLGRGTGRLNGAGICR